MDNCVEVGNYILLQTLGTGSTGKVKLAENKITHEQFAIKIIQKSYFQDNKELEIKIHREIAIMKLLDHPHLLKLIDVFESPRHLYMVIEYASHGELFDYLIERRSLTSETAIKFFRQIIYGLEYLHSNSICHRDLKPENILLDSNESIKIADFGLAKCVRFSTMGTSCGSPHYVAPEVVKGEPYDGRCADIWSAGVIFYTLLSGRLPFDDTSLTRLIEKIKEGKYRIPNFDPNIKDLISRILVVDPKKRITIEQIKQHPAFRMSIPEDYVFPKPLPIPKNNTIIDINSIDSSLLNVFKLIGYNNDEEIISDLKSDGFNLAKSFYNLIREKMSFNQLPWPEDDNDSYQTNFDQQRNNFMFTSESEQPVSSLFTVQINDPYYRKKSLMTSSYNIYSLAEPAGWVYDVPEDLDQYTTSTISQIYLQLEVISEGIQQTLNQEGFCWFYPNEFLLLAKRSHDDLNIIIRIDYDDFETYSVGIHQIHGDSSQFHLFVNNLITKFNELCL